jgi:hypothetical protein
MACEGEGWFTYMLKQQSRWLTLRDFKITYSSEKTKTAVMVEPRPHPMLRAVVDNIMHALGPEWNLHIFTSVKNKEWLTKTMEPHEYMVNTFNMENITREQYSELLMTPSFWKLIHTESILIFQTDCIAFRPWDPMFEQYDYIGANYYHPMHILPCIGGIQGGLSYRKKSAMLRCLEEVPRKTINDFRNQHGLEPISFDGIAEDVYFTHACAMLNMRLMDAPMRHYFAIEADYFFIPFGFHGWQHPYFTKDQNHELIKRSLFFRKFLCIDE